MKRIVVFILATLALVSPLFVKQEKLSFSDATKLCVVSKEDIELPQSTQKIKNGEQFYYLFDQNFDKALSNFDKIDGLNTYYQKDFKKEELLKKHDVQSYYTSSSAGIEIVYGYTNSYHDFRYVNGKKINIQIAFTDTEVVVGFPLILTGF